MFLKIIEYASIWMIWFMNLTGIHRLSLTAYQSLEGWSTRESTDAVQRGVGLTDLAADQRCELMTVSLCFESCSCNESSSLHPAKQLKSLIMMNISLSFMKFPPAESLNSEFIKNFMVRQCLLWKGFFKLQTTV